MKINVCWNPPSLPNLNRLPACDPPYIFWEQPLNASKIVYLVNTSKIIYLLNASIKMIYVLNASKYMVNITVSMQYAEPI